MITPVIAVIDADPVFRDLMYTFLSEEGFEPVCLPGFLSASDLLERIQPRLVILDSWLTHPHDGEEILTHIRQHPTAKHLPVILSSTDVTSVRESYWDPRCQILAKPFNLEDMLQMVNAGLAAEVTWLPCSRPKLNHAG